MNCGRFASALPHRSCPRKCIAGSPDSDARSTASTIAGLPVDVGRAMLSNTCSRRPRAKRSSTRSSTGSCSPGGRGMSARRTWCGRSRMPLREPAAGGGPTRNTGSSSMRSGSSRMPVAGLGRRHAALRLATTTSAGRAWTSHVASRIEPASARWSRNAGRELLRPVWWCGSGNGCGAKSKDCSEEYVTGGGRGRPMVTAPPREIRGLPPGLVRGGPRRSPASASSPGNPRRAPRR